VVALAITVYPGRPLGALYPMYVTKFLPLLALPAAAIAAWSALSADGWLLGATCGFGWTLLALAMIDITQFRLPNILTLPLAAIGLLVTYGVDPDLLLNHMFGAAIGFVVFAAIRESYLLLRGYEGLGLGDAKLMAAFGAWLGWQALPSVVLIGSLSGIAVTLLQMVCGEKAAADRRLPFGAYLSLGGWLVWLYGPIGIQ
jgi:leader peptidase (prepilin peptidase)/N-methyltransferase